MKSKTYPAGWFESGHDAPGPAEMSGMFLTGETVMLRPMDAGRCPSIALRYTSCTSVYYTDGVEIPVEL